jgi:uncharacterized protein
MMLADVNVLVSAFRPDAEHHRLCREWLDRCAGGESSFAVAPQVLSSVIRVSTHRRIFRTPSLLSEVLLYCARLMDLPHAHIVQPGEGHWAIFERLCVDANATENLVPDAWFAAIAIEHGCEWVTLDRDFARFPGLRWRGLG